MRTLCAHDCFQLYLSVLLVERKTNKFFPFILNHLKTVLREPTDNDFNLISCVNKRQK